MNETRILEIEPAELEKRLENFETKYGVDRDLFLAFLDSPLYSQVTKGLSKARQRKLRRYLKGGDEIFSRICPFLANDVLIARSTNKDPYEQFILDRLGAEDVRAYQTGKWTQSVLDVVSVAQKKYVIPSRARSPSEKDGAIKFQPTSEYKARYNR